MGKELGTVFYALYNEFCWLRLRWRQHVELFGTSPERVDLLNDVANLFFRFVQDSFWDDTLLHISRMTDSPTTSGRKNLTIQRLPSLIADKALAADIANLVSDAVSLAAFARDWRNRAIAHSDLQLAVEEGATPLTPASRRHVALAMQAIDRVLNRSDEGARVNAEYVGASPGA
jgi:hypothetical protein